MDRQGYEALQSFVVIAGIYEGVVPFAGKWFGWRPFLAFPLRLPNPAWWIVSAAVVVLSIALLEVLDRAKKQVG